MSDDDAKAALHGWVTLGLTRRKAKMAQVRVDQQRLALLSACAKSSDGNVREALRAFVEAQRLVNILDGKEEP
jgi:hypothetical protein